VSVRGPGLDQPTARPVADPRLARRLLLACRLAIGIRLLLLFGILSFPLVLLSAALWNEIYLGVLATFAASMAVYMGLAATLKCPACKRRFLMESDPPLPGARREEPFGVWGTMVWAIVRHREFSCMYCGAAWHLP